MPVLSRLIMGCLAGGSQAPAQDLRHNVRVVNIEVPARVFEGEKFIDDLKLADFEILEDGVPQTIEACHLVRGADVARSEGQAAAAKPGTARTIVLLFQVWSYFAEINEAVDVVFDRVILPGDSLIVLTPLKTYSMADNALARLSGERLKEQLRSRLRQDIIAAGREYREALRLLEAAVSSPSDENMAAAREYLTRLEGLRRIATKDFVGFARFLKNREGSKHVFLFYQVERLPKLSARRQNELMGGNPYDVNMLFNLMDQDLFKRDPAFDIRTIREAFSDSSVAIQFLFLTKIPVMEFDITALRPSPDIVYVEHSEDVYRAFDEIARATGGITVRSSNPAFALGRAAAAAEAYYLLYYTPRAGGAKPGFREIEVRVTRPGVMVNHRAGYLAEGEEPEAAKPSGRDVRSNKKPA